MSKIVLTKPELLRIYGENGNSYMGGSQEWYKDAWQRTSGCGPTTASGILWYLSRLSTDFASICNIGNAGISSFLDLMEEMFAFITPSKMGVNTTAIFTEGIKRYAKNRGVELHINSLEIPSSRFCRPKSSELGKFISDSLLADAPVAFLNLSNGTLKNLDNWHWVMLIELEPESMTATMCDQGKIIKIDVGEWLKTTMLGGGMVRVSLAN